jgi:hypothetical protein
VEAVPSLVCLLVVKQVAAATALLQYLHDALRSERKGPDGVVCRYKYVRRVVNTISVAQLAWYGRTYIIGHLLLDGSERLLD